MALIANNGTGKSSLLKIIAGTDIAMMEVLLFVRNQNFLSREPDFNQSLYRRAYQYSSYRRYEIDS